MQIVATAIPEVKEIKPVRRLDPRGFFSEIFREELLRQNGIDVRFVQENHSRSTYGTLRGLHYQRAPKAQGKLVRAIVGEIFDVAVDIRRGSPTFGAWFGVRLSAANRRLLYVPPWCAHGFCVVSPEAEVIYNTTEEYAPDCEEGLRWDDRGISIPWPVSSPILSERDRRWPLLGDSAASAVCC